jgi:hypothetical protein
VVGRTGSLNVSVVDSASLGSLQPIAVTTGVASPLVDGTRPILHVIGDSGTGPSIIAATDARVSNAISFGR